MDQHGKADEIKLIAVLPINHLIHAYVHFIILHYSHFPLCCAGHRHDELDWYVHVVHVFDGHGGTAGLAIIGGNE